MEYRGNVPNHGTLPNQPRGDAHLFPRPDHNKDKRYRSMSQRSEKLHRQVTQLRSDVDALQVAWLSQQHCDAVELAAAAERTRQAHRRASKAQRTARAWKLNAILTLILAALIAAVVRPSFSDGRCRSAKRRSLRLQPESRAARPCPASRPRCPRSLPDAPCLCS